MLRTRWLCKKRSLERPGDLPCIVSQVLDQWNWVMDWEELISPVHLVSILDKLFFPKWLQVSKC